MTSIPRAPVVPAEPVPAVVALRILGNALAPVALPTGIPSGAAAVARMESGVPALAGEPLLSGAQLIEGIATLASALSLTSLGAAADQAASDIAAIAAQMDPDELAECALAGDWEQVAEVTVRAGREPDAIITLLDHACRPALTAGAAALTDSIARSGWRRVHCPACGALALLAEQRGGGVAGSAEGERVLRCGRCLAGWPVPRLGCPSCGETDHRRFTSLHGAGEFEYRRADACMSCKAYVKAVTVLAPLTHAGLLEADFASSALDLSAIERGYHR